MNKITPEEFKNRMISLSSNEYNEEDAHIDADNLTKTCKNSPTSEVVR
jgi:hypothetical protein